MLKKNLINKIIFLLSIFHFGISVSCLLIPIFVNNKSVLNFIYNYTIFAILGWIIFDGRCWLSDIEKKLYKIVNNKPVSKKNIIVHYFNTWFGIKINDDFGDKLFYTLAYTSIFILICKLNKLNQGFSLLFGWILFKMALDNSKKYQK